jgi:hypothetical protein
MMDLLYEAASIHREHHDPNGSGFNIIVHKTGGCRKIAVIPKPQDTTLQWKATI